MVVGPVWPFISMISFTCWTIYVLGGWPSAGGQLSEPRGDMGQARGNGQVLTGDIQRHGCWASWAFDHYDLFHMFTGWMLHSVQRAR